MLFHRIVSKETVNRDSVVRNLTKTRALNVCFQRVLMKVSLSMSYSLGILGDRQPNECWVNRCLNNGVCTSLEPRGFACQCPAGYEGLQCERKISVGSRPQGAFNYLFLHLWRLCLFLKRCCGPHIHVSEKNG